MNKKTTLFMVVALMTIILVQTKITKANNQIDSAKSKADILEERKAAIEAKKTEWQENIAAKKEELQQKRCEVAQKRISTKFGQLENNRKMYQTVYANMNSRLTRLVQRLDEAKLDTTQLKTDLATLNTMIEKLHTDYAAFATEFKGTETAACEKTKVEFKNQFTEARAKTAQIKKDRTAIKDFFNSTIKPELQSLKAEIAEEAEQAKIKAKNKIKQNETTDTTTPSSETTTTAETEILN
ncbi:MAG: hypothetical protein ACD_11C00018G0042 [uncultured bacterium]|nr:MAG: hypothetical protein ACD_11C00018G0042 [uncultured bacterium]HBR71567.1 hypothetical protein [Candidatus Moranbacteria bacterium]